MLKSQTAAPMRANKFNPPSRKGTGSTQSGEPKVEMNPSSLQNLTVPQDVRTILAKAGVEIRITINAGGTLVNLYDIDKNYLGSIEDLNKILAIRKFISQEEKSSQSEDMRRETEKVLVRVDNLLVTNKRESITSVPDNIVLLYKQCKYNISQLERVIKSVSLSTATEDSEHYRKVVLNMAERTKIVLSQLIVDYITSRTTKGDLDELLFLNSIPKWFYLKLVSPNTVIPETFNFRKFIFPVNTARGLQLTIREFVNGPIQKEMDFLLANMQVFRYILSDITIVHSLIGSDLKLLPEKEAFFKTKLYVTPPMDNFGDVLAYHNRVGSKGVDLPPFSGGLGTIAALSNISIALLGFFYLVPKVGDPISDFYPRITEHVMQLPRQMAVPRNLPQQIYDIYVVDKESISIDRLFRVNQDLRLLLSATFGVAIDHKAIKALEPTPIFGVDKDNKPIPVVIQTIGNEKLSNIIKMVTKPLDINSPLSSDEYHIAKQKNLIATPKSKTLAKTVSRGTVPTPKAKVLFEILKDRRKTHLLNAIEDYLRSFQIELLQSAAAELIIARLDEYLNPSYSIEEESEEISSHYDDDQ